MIRTAVFVLFALCSSPAACSTLNFTCRNDQFYTSFKICIIPGVNWDVVKDIADVNFPNVTKMELLNSNFDEFGVEMFQLLEDTEKLTLRNGFVRTILFWSYTLSSLQVINTDLHMFDVLGQPNYSLKTLAVRSKTFSYWSPNMGFLKGLEVLDLAHCNFTYLNLDWMSTFHRLRVLDVSNNRLHSFHSGPHIAMNALEELFLSDNQLEYLWRFPDAFPKLTLLSLASNKWLCDWVTIARDSIWVLNVTLMDSDFSCRKGWQKNGGLCCKQSKNFIFKGSTDLKRKSATKTERVIEETELVQIYSTGTESNSSTKVECVLNRNENGDIIVIKTVLQLQEISDENNTKTENEGEPPQVTVILDKPLPFD